MKYTTLPNTEIEVSKICLGTMTFGQQNTEAEGHEQMDYALEKELILGHSRDVFCSCT
jgi:aryl-alcohol dehydrogenase-like predicted oxidoreductase